MLVHNARTRKPHGFRLTVDRVQRALETGVGERTGLKFDLRSGRGRTPWSPSIDRKNPKLGYTDENVVVDVWAYNAMKGDWDEDVILIVADALRLRKQSEHQERKKSANPLRGR